MEEYGSEEGSDCCCDLIRGIIDWKWSDLWEGNTEEEPGLKEGGFGRRVGGAGWRENRGGGSRKYSRASGDSRVALWSRIG